MEVSCFYPHLEIQVVEHCNLNCASCTHFSSIAKEKFVDKKSFYEQLEKAYVIFKDYAKSLKIMGGEPLLHPELTELLILARQAMPEMKITLQTNGILLNQMSEEFWKVCHKYDIFIRITRYPVKLDISEIYEIAQKYCVNIKCHPSENIIKSFNKYPLSVLGENVATESYEKCKIKQRYVVIKEGRLYPCPIVANIEHFNTAFGKNLMRKDADSIELDSVNQINEYFDFANKCIAFCKYCKAGEYEREIGWKTSNKTIDEWV